MKIPLLASAALALVVTALVHAENYSFKESFSRTSPFNPTGEIVLENINGGVDVRTWDKNEILIEGEKSAKTDEELKLIDLGLELTPADATIKVRLPKRPGSFLFGGNIRAAVSFKLTVPATAVLKKISTVNSSVTIAGVRGLVHGSTVNGAIQASGLGGEVNLETVNGSIKAQFETLTAQQELSFETVNGQINVSLPKDAGFELSSSVVNGSVDCDFPLQPGQKNHGRNLSGKIGDGRASLRAQTVNGGIHLEQR
jgi:Putative adhesin